jgi:hypothetical protein
MVIVMGAVVTLPTAADAASVKAGGRPAAAVGTGAELALQTNVAGVVPTTVTISCSLTVHDPHNSSHIPEFISANAVVSCTSPVAGLSTTVVLYGDGLPVGSASNSNGGAASLSTTVNTSCVDGQYEAVANTWVTFPPGYRPATAKLSKGSNLVSIVCA